MGERVRVWMKHGWSCIDNCWGWVTGKWKLIAFFSTVLGMSEDFHSEISHLCEHFAVLKSRAIHSRLIICSCMNSSPLDLTLLFPILLLKGILCQVVREVMAGVFAVRLHWASSDDTDPFIMWADMPVMPGDNGHKHRLCSQIVWVWSLPLPLTSCTPLAGHLTSLYPSFAIPKIGQGQYLPPRCITRTEWVYIAKRLRLYLHTVGVM